jgi:hypothetical protein
MDPLQVDVLTDVAEQGTPTVSEFSLAQNYPNPFNPSTTISFSLAQPAHVRLDLYNQLGERVASLVDEHRAAGYHSVKLNGSTLASGVYYYRLHAGDFVATRKLLLLR